MLPSFLAEADELLVQADQDLTLLESDPGNGELLNRIFRAMHTLKGTSAFVGLRRLNELAHVLEDVLDGLRKRRVRMTPELMDGVLAGTRALDQMVAGLKRGEGEVLSVAEPVALLRQRLRETEGETPAPAAGEVPTRAPDQSAISTPQAAKGGVAFDRTLRVDISKVDAVMNLVGEFVIHRISLDQRIRRLESLVDEADSLASSAAGRRGNRMITQVASSLPDYLRSHSLLLREVHEQLDRSGDTLARLASDLQDTVMKLRMVPVSFVLSRFPRLVRDLSRALGKDVRLTILGGETEFDRALIEHLADPLLHLIRNSIDHGIESPADRLALGKPRAGMIRLEASHRGNELVVEVEDDGGGIDAERVRAAAVERGVISAEEAIAMAREDVLRLIFAAGLSTKSEVTDVSGRGVGMDVVLANVSKLKGKIEVDSEPGIGTLITIRLPITLAILEALLVHCGGQTLAIPIHAVEEVVEVVRTAVRQVRNREVIELRGRTVSLLSLAHLLGLRGGNRAGPERVPVVLVGSAEKRVGLAVDELIGKQEVVVRSLGNVLRRLRFIAGGTILGDGRVVLILDVPPIVEAASTGRLEVVAPEAPPPPALSGEEKRGAGRESGAAGARARVLVVDDSATAREAIQRVLGSLGVETVEARDGREALELAAAGRFDLVTTDLMMPVMDGFELTRSLRRLPGYAAVPILMVSARSDEMDRMRGREAGATEYIPKPMEADRLIRAVLRGLGREE